MEIITGALVSADDWMDRHTSIGGPSYRTPRTGELTTVTLMIAPGDICHVEVPRLVWAPLARPSAADTQADTGDIITLTSTPDGWTAARRRPTDTESPLALAAFRQAFLARQHRPSARR